MGAALMLDRDEAATPEHEPLRRLWERGKNGFPGHELPFETFARFVVLPLAAEPELLHAEDMVLAASCLAGARGAAEELERRHGRDLQLCVARVGVSPAIAQEIAQELLISCLVGDGVSPPCLSHYRGRGPLRAWLRMAATRRTLNLARDLSRRARIDSRLVEATTRMTGDPEVTLLKVRYQADFAAACRDAIAGLDPAERVLLKLHYGEGVRLSALAALHHCSTATACRRLAAARASYLAGVSALLRERLRVDPAELESIYRLVASDLQDLSLSGLWRSAAL